MTFQSIALTIAILLTYNIAFPNKTHASEPIIINSDSSVTISKLKTKKTYQKFVLSKHDDKTSKAMGKWDFCSLSEIAYSHGHNYHSRQHSCKVTNSLSQDKLSSISPDKQPEWTLTVGYAQWDSVDCAAICFSRN